MILILVLIAGAALFAAAAIRAARRRGGTRRRVRPETAAVLAKIDAARAQLAETDAMLARTPWR